MNSCYICGETSTIATSLHHFGGELNDSANRLIQKRRAQYGGLVQLPVATRRTAQCQSCIEQFGTCAALSHNINDHITAPPVIGEYHGLGTTVNVTCLKDGAFLDAAVSAMVSPQGVVPPSVTATHSSMDTGIWSLYHTAIASLKSAKGGNEEGIMVVPPEVQLTSWKMKSLMSLRYPSVRLEPTPNNNNKGEASPSLRLVALSSIEQGATIDLSSVPTVHNDDEDGGEEGPQRNISTILINPATPMSSYMTHSCNPNTQLLGLQPTERSSSATGHSDDDEASSYSYQASVIITLRNITPNEPLTIDTEALPPYFKAASIALRQEELLRRRAIRRAMDMDRGYHFISEDNSTPSHNNLGKCQCEACVGDALLPELLQQHHQQGHHYDASSTTARLNITPFQRILIKEGVVSNQDSTTDPHRQQILTPTTLEELVCGNRLRYDLSRSFACPLSPLCKDGVVYPSSSVTLSVSGALSNNTSDVIVWRCDSCLEWWVVNTTAAHTTLSPTIRSIVRFEEQAIGKVKEALSTIKMLHSGYVPIAEVLPLLDGSSGTSSEVVEDVRRRAMASLHHMEEMGSKPLTNKCYTALKDLLQSCVDAGMVMDVTPRESSFNNLNHAPVDTSSHQGDAVGGAKNVPHIQSRCSHWVYSSACLYMSLYFSELGTRRLKGEGEQEAALSFAVRWMKLYLRSMLPLSWVGGSSSSGTGGASSSLLWNRTKVSAGGAAMTLARAIQRFPRQYTNAKYLTIFAYVSGYVTMKMALGKCITAGSGVIINADTVEFIKSHNAVQVPEIKEIEALLVSSSITTTTPNHTTNTTNLKHITTTDVSSNPQRRGQVWYWLHHGETGFGSSAHDDSNQNSAAGGGAETHEEVLKDWEEYLMELSRKAMTRQQNPNLPPEVVQAMRGLGR